jgi:integrase
VERNKLNDRKVRAASPGRHGDGGGLYLQVRGASRSWLFLYRWQGRRVELGLGAYPAISLARARQIAAELTSAKTEGIDPRQARNKRRVHSVTFGQCAEMMLTDLEPGWSNVRYRYQYRRSLTVEAALLRDLSVGGIGTDDVLRVLQPLWLTRPDSARRLRLRIEKLLSWAKARGFRDGPNPAAWRDHLVNLLPRQIRVQQQHFAAMDYREVPAFLTEVRGMRGTGARGLELLILTAVRSNEIRDAEWSEFDLASKTWTIPAHRMKSRREHRVPLSNRAVTILTEMVKTRRSEFLLPSYNSHQHGSHELLRYVLRRLGRGQYTAHGFRSSFRDWAAERTTIPSEIAEIRSAMRQNALISDPMYSSGAPILCSDGRISAADRLEPL